jgi:hypothetical protein
MFFGMIPVLRVVRLTVFERSHVDVFDESTCALANDPVRDSWTRTHQTPEFGPCEHEQLRVGLGFDRRGSPPARGEQRDFTDDCPRSDCDVATFKSDVDFALEDDEAFMTNVASST